MTTNADWKSALARAAAVAALLAFTWALVVALTGGFRVRIGGILVSSRDPLRFAIAAAVLYATSLLLGRPGYRSEVWAWLRDRVERWSPVVVWVSAALVLWLGVTQGARTAGGADAFGYVSQAYLWLKGDLQIEQPLAAQVPWPLAGESLCPLGYRTGAVRHTCVPSYSPGVPLIMAGFHLLFGTCGPFFVQPVFGALLVALTFVLANRLTRDRLTSAVAAVFMASSPTLLFNIVLPMSDTVTAALWVAALALLTWPRVWQAGMAGCVAGVAILARPNLFPLALAGVLAAELWMRREDAPRRGARGLAFLAGVIPAAIAVGILNAQLYGSPLQSGYGRTTALYAIGAFPTNLRLYTAWLIESQSPVVLLALVPIIFRGARPAWLTFRVAGPPLVLVAVLCVSYLFYQVFDVWWFLRFFLAAFPFLFVLLAAVVVRLTRIAPPTVALPALVLVLALLLKSWLGFVLPTGMLDNRVGEQRFAVVAEYAAERLPPNAILVAMQHSGTMSFYSGRLTLRYDFIGGQRLNSTIDWLTANGYRPYIVLDEWEERNFRQRFGARDALSRLEIPVIAETTSHTRVRVYDPLAPFDTVPLRLDIHPRPGRGCGGPLGAWQ